MKITTQVILGFAVAAAAGAAIGMLLAPEKRNRCSGKNQRKRSRLVESVFFALKHRARCCCRGESKSGAGSSEREGRIDRSTLIVLYRHLSNSYGRE